MVLKKKGSEEPLVVIEVEVTKEGKVKIKGKKKKA
jgi:hypothetical protein